MILEIVDADGTAHAHKMRPVFSLASVKQIVQTAILEHAEATLYDEFGCPIYSEKQRQQVETLEETEP